MKIISIATIAVLLISGCTVRRKPLAFVRTDYKGDEFRTDGYYYSTWADKDVNHFYVYFFYRNGIRYYPGVIRVETFQELETRFLSKYAHENRNNVPYGWGIYKVVQDTIIFSGWSTSVGGPYPAYESKYQILNDTTLYNFTLDETYYFKKFPNKPDSTNIFIE